MGTEAPELHLNAIRLLLHLGDGWRLALDEPSAAYRVSLEAPGWRWHRWIDASALHRSSYLEVRQLADSMAADSVAALVGPDGVGEA